MRYTGDLSNVRTRVVIEPRTRRKVAKRAAPPAPITPEERRALLDKAAKIFNDFEEGEK
jgi:hypothetical protein